jgi:hypothetical protein
MSALGRLQQPARILTLLLSLFAATAAAQRSGGAEDVAGCAACAGIMGGLILIPILFIALNIALLVWVAKDAKARGMDNAVLWMILVMATSIIGLLIYIFSRPQGNLVRCNNCSNMRLQSSAKCPHCGNA